MHCSIEPNRSIDEHSVCPDRPLCIHDRLVRRVSVRTKLVRSRRTDGDRAYRYSFEAIRLVSPRFSHRIRPSEAGRAVLEQRLPDLHVPNGPGAAGSARLPIEPDRLGIDRDHAPVGYCRHKASEKYPGRGRGPRWPKTATLYFSYNAPCCFIGSFGVSIIIHNIIFYY